MRTKLTEPMIPWESGVSRIEAAIEAGKLKASKSGPRGSRVIKRSDLEAWVRKL